MFKTIIKATIGIFLVVGCSSMPRSSAAPQAPLRWSDHPAATAKGRKIDFALLEAADKGQTAQVKKLLAQGANINATGADNLGRTALMFAAWKGHTSTVKFLLDKNANWKTQDKGRRTAIMFAIVAQHGDVTQMLIREGADINGQD